MCTEVGSDFEEARAEDDVDWFTAIIDDVEGQGVAETMDDSGVELSSSMRCVVACEVERP